MTPMIKKYSAQDLHFLSEKILPVGRLLVRRISIKRFYFSNKNSILML